MESEKAYRVHRESPVEHVLAARHVASRDKPLLVGVRHDRDDVSGAGGDVVGDRAVTRRPDVLHALACLLLVGQNAALHLRPGAFRKLCIRSHSDCGNENVKRNFVAVREDGFVLVEAFRACPENELHAVRLDVLLHDLRCFLVENGRQNPVCKVDDGHVAIVVFKRFRGFQTYQTRADYQHFRTLSHYPFDALHVVHFHEAEAVLHRIEPVHWRHERLRAGREQELFIPYLFAAFELYFLSFTIYRNRLFAEHGLHAVRLVEVRRAVVHLLFCHVALELV